MNSEIDGKEEGEDFKRMAFQLLTEFTFSTIQSLVDTSSSLRALELNRPYWSHAGKAAGLFLKKQLGLENQDMSTVAYSFRVIELTFGREMIWSNDENAPITTICPFKDAPPEFCILFDVVVGNGFLESLSPDYEIVMEEMMSQGAPYCKSILRLKGSEVLIPPLKDVSNVDLTREQLDDLAIQYLGEHWVMATRAALDFEDSPETFSLLKMRMRQQGMSKALHYRQMLGIQGDDVYAIGAILDFLNSLLRQEGKTVSSSKDFVEKEIVQCPFRDSPGAICDQLEAFTNGVCEAINSEFELVHKGAMCKGDSKCSRVVKRKGTALKEKHNVVDRTEEITPLIVLEMRLAKGEISLEEFERTIASLKKHGLAKQV